MARNVTTKKTISFENASIIESIVKDIAIDKNRSSSAIIENILLDALLPPNDKAKWICEHCLYGDDGGTGRATTTVFENNSHGINGLAVHYNLAPLVHFAYNQESASCGRVLTGNEENLPRVCTLFVFLFEILEQRLEDMDETREKFFIERKIALGRDHFNELEHNPSDIRLINFYQFFSDCWEFVKDLSVTYRILADLVKLGNWQDTHKTRLEFLKILRDVSAEW